MNLFAQIVAENPALYAYGPLGIICAFFMWRDVARDRERAAFVDKLGDVGHRMDGLTKALLVDMIHRTDIGVTTKRYAVEQIAKIDAREVTDGKKKPGSG